MRIAISGATGFVGSALSRRLAAAGHTVRPIVRRDRGRADDIRWDPAAGWIDTDGLAEIDGVVHLAGESIAGYWTAGRRRRIYDSRVTGTRVLVDALLAHPRPRTVIGASAIGFYGSRGEQRLTEDDGPGRGFMAQLCQDWEAEARRATESGARVVSTRFGVIQAPNSGMLKSMLLPAKVGPVARFGHGRRYQSWITLNDLLRAIEFTLATESVSGAVNVTAPNPVSNAEYATTLARLLHRPVIPVPPILLRAALPGVSDELLLQSAWVRPAGLLGHGFTFDDPILKPALEKLIRGTG